jgi:hypothetical protein
MANTTNPIISLETYYNYARAWEIALERKYGIADSAKHTIQREQLNLNTFDRLQGGVISSNQLDAEFLRGKLTLMAIRKLPVADFPDLAATANLWLPVQAYYTINAMGNAALLALNLPIPKTHRAFRAAFTANIVRLMPFPFNAVCTGGPLPLDFAFSGIKTAPDQVASQSQLANPYYSEGDDFIGKSLSTTRSRSLKGLLEIAKKKNVRPGHKSRRLPGEEQSKIVHSLHGTSIADLLYRMRRRSNYDNPDMYLEAFNNADSALVHYQTLAYVTEILVRSLEEIIEKKLGKEAIARMASILPQEL